VSAAIDPATLLRPGLLEGVSVLLAGADGTRAAAIGETLGDLGAQVAPWRAAGSASVTPATFAAPATSAGSSTELPYDAAAAKVGLLVVDAAEIFVASPEDALRVSLEVSWEATQEVATAAFIEPGRPGRILYIAPAPDAGTHADGARAGLENLARTLSIEWARYAITTVAIALGSQTADAEVVTLLAYLASPAGAYFSGCQLDLRGLAGAGTV